MMWNWMLSSLATGNSIILYDGNPNFPIPAPCMPLYFWNNPEMKKYKEAYFPVYPNIWRHGDYVMFHKDTGGTFFGRSDSVLKPSGVRIGTAEI